MEVRSGAHPDPPPESFTKRYFWWRVGALLLVLFVVLLWAFAHVRRLRTRTDWERTLHIALVVVEREDVDDEAVRAVLVRARELEARLFAEIARYRPGATRPFAIHVFGPVSHRELPPRAAVESLTDLVRYTLRLREYLSQIDELGAIDSNIYDSRVYLVVTPPSAELRALEGVGQQGGRIGLVEVELAPDMVDLSLAVAAHELFHTLGATDRYDATGRAVVPDGLAEPDRDPRYPQRLVEIMARNRPISPTLEVPLERLDELTVGLATAREIGWVK